MPNLTANLRAIKVSDFPAQLPENEGYNHNFAIYLRETATRKRVSPISLNCRLWFLDNDTDNEKLFVLMDSGYKRVEATIQKYILLEENLGPGCNLSGTFKLLVISFRTSYTIHKQQISQLDPSVFEQVSSTEGNQFMIPLSSKSWSQVLCNAKAKGTLGLPHKQLILQQKATTSAEHLI